jgi:hypothetical protein
MVHEEHVWELEQINAEKEEEEAKAGADGELLQV